MLFSVSDAIETRREPPSSPGMNPHFTGDNRVIHPGSADSGCPSAHVAVLDRSGRIIAVNQAWSRFAADNDGLAGTDRRGRQLSGGLRASAGQECAEASATLEGLKTLLDGSQNQFRLEYPCHSPAERRRFLLHATPLRHSPGGIVTTHLTITDRKLAELAVEQSAAELALSNDLLLKLATDRESAGAIAAASVPGTRDCVSGIESNPEPACPGREAVGPGPDRRRSGARDQQSAGFRHEQSLLARRDVQGMTELITLYESCHEAPASTMRVSGPDSQAA